MKKMTRILIVGAIIAIFVSICSVGAIDTKNVDEQIAPAATYDYNGYDIGSYGWSSPEEYTWNTNITYSVARYKRTTNDCAANYVGKAVSIAGGWAGWYVHCVSDGEHATDDAYMYAGFFRNTTADYYYSYGTKGYTNKLHVFGHNGSMGAGLNVSYAAWCPDGEDAPLSSYVTQRAANEEITIQ